MRAAIGSTTKVIVISGPRSMAQTHVAHPLHMRHQPLSVVFLMRQLAVLYHGLEWRGKGCSLVWRATIPRIRMNTKICSTAPLKSVARRAFWGEAM